MPRYRLIALCLGLATVCAHGQQPVSSSSEPAKGNAQLERVKVYRAGPGVTPPVLLPLALSPFSNEKCKEHTDGRVLLSVLVDTAGLARNIMLIDPIGSELDTFAIRIAGADRFTPGTSDGKHVVVAESLEVRIQSCLVETQDGTGKKIYSLQLKAAPIQTLAPLANPPAEAVLTASAAISHSAIDVSAKSNHVGGKVSAPVPIRQPEAVYTREASRRGITGSCLIEFIVDAHGMPQDLRVKKSLEPGLDKNALAAVNKYRFKPAMRDGEPIPVSITVEVNFQLTF